jgi:hypothetical protein
VLRQGWLRAYDFTTDRGAAALNDYAPSNPLPGSATHRLQIYASPGQITDIALEPGEKAVQDASPRLRRCLWHPGGVTGAALIAVGTEVNLGTDVNNTNSAIVQTLRRGAGDSLNQTGQQLVRRNLNIRPTLTIRPGCPVRARNRAVTA